MDGHHKSWYISITKLPTVLREVGEAHSTD
jgi:hypothetical protein